MTTATAAPAPTARVTARLIPTVTLNSVVEVARLHRASTPLRADTLTVRLSDGRQYVMTEDHLDMLPIPAVDGHEWINGVIADHWVCVCGNDPCADGFFTTYRSGVDVDPGGDDWPREGECYACARCGRIGSQTERDALGRVPVLGVAEKLPTGVDPD